MQYSEMPPTREASVDPVYRMPQTREPSPMPVWNDPNCYTMNGEFVANTQNYGEQSWNANCAMNGAQFARQSGPQGRAFVRRSSRDAPAMPAMQVMQPGMQSAPVMQPDGKPSPYQTVLLVPQNQPVLFVQPGQTGPIITGGSGVPMPGQVMPYPVQSVPMMQAPHMMSGMPTPSAEPSPQQPSAPASDATPEPDEKAQWKSNGRNKNRGYFKSDSGLSKMSGDQKAALAKYIFDFMVKKGFTSPEGYLIVDVFSEVWKEMGDSAEG